MQRIKVLLVATDGVARAEYISEIRNIGISVDITHSVLSAFERFGKNRYSGILMDVPTLLRSTSADKKEANLLIDHFPVLRLNYKTTEGIRCIPTGKYSGFANSLEGFLRESCLHFKPRSLRGTKRGTKVLNVLLNKDLNSPARVVEKSITINFSSEGAFFYTVAPWSVGDVFWAVFKELSDRTPIKAEVSRVNLWGKTDRIPGIGVKFLHLSEAQADQLDELIQLRKV